jgi:hypothetical protein
MGLEQVDQRLEARQLTNRAGIAKAGQKEIMVVLRNTSEEGACVRPVGSGSIPDRFRLIVAMEKIDTECVVVWRRGRDCGIRFE